MKKLLVSFLLLVLLKADAQLLQGKWEGYFKEQLTGTQYRYSIEFFGEKDTALTAIGITYFEDKERVDTVGCAIEGGTINKVLFLRETEILKCTAPQYISNCLQKFRLYFKEKKGKKILEGEWEGVEQNCGNGKIYLEKKED